jgi:hypothetical protein
MAEGNPNVSDHSPPPQRLLASGWQRGCGQMIMIFGIGLTMLSGLCTMGMTIEVKLIRWVSLRSTHPTRWIKTLRRLRKSARP